MFLSGLWSQDADEGRSVAVESPRGVPGTVVPGSRSKGSYRDKRTPRAPRTRIRGNRHRDEGTDRRLRRRNGESWGRTTVEPGPEQDVWTDRPTAGAVGRSGEASRKGRDGKGSGGPGTVTEDTYSSNPAPARVLSPGPSTTPASKLGSGGRDDPRIPAGLTPTRQGTRCRRVSGGSKWSGRYHLPV